MSMSSSHGPKENHSAQSSPTVTHGSPEVMYTQRPTQWWAV